VGQNNPLYYSVDSDNPDTRSSTTQSLRIYPGQGSSSGRYIYLNLTSNGQSKKIYLYFKSGNNVSEPTVVTVTRNSNNNYTFSYVNGAQTTNSGSNYNLIITFNDGEGTYGWSNTSSGSRTWFTGSTLTIPCSRLSYNNNVSTVYIVSRDAAGNESEATSLRVRRNGYSSTSYTYNVETITHGVGGSTVTQLSTATMALWSSGRVDGSSGYLTYWFGPAGDTGDGWINEAGDGNTQNNVTVKAPFTESRYTYGMTYTPIAIGRYTTSNTEMTAGGAVPIRCIREYDNVSTSTVNE
jgi:hypothetical protein